MYSNIEYQANKNTCGNYKKEGDCWNKEHSIPASWFNDASPMYSDLFQVYPTDGYVNNRRSNFPFGEVQTAKYISKNGSKLGSSVDVSSKEINRNEAVYKIQGNRNPFIDYPEFSKQIWG